MKFGLPMSASASTLIYGMLFFEDGYKSAGQYEEALRQIRWPLDYFMKCFQQPDRFYAQVCLKTRSSSSFGCMHIFKLVITTSPHHD